MTMTTDDANQCQPQNRKKIVRIFVWDKKKLSQACWPISRNFLLARLILHLCECFVLYEMNMHGFLNHLPYI